MENTDKKAEEDEAKSGKREVEEGRGRVAVVCKRACPEPLSCLSGNVSEEEVVEVSGGERESWCEVSVCGPASAPPVLTLIALLDMMRELDLAAPDFEVDEPQTLSFSTKAWAQCFIQHEQHKKAEAVVETASPVDVDAQEFLRLQGTGRRILRKVLRCKNGRRGLAHRRSHRLR